MGGAIEFGSPNTLTSTAAIDIKDNILLTLGDDADGVLVNRSTILAADTALTGVLTATVEAQAIAANSLLIANNTSNGDIAMYINKATNSQMVFWADGDTGNTAIMASTGQSVDTYIAGTKEIDYATGAFTFQQATTLSTSTGALTVDGDDGIILQTTGSGLIQAKEIISLGTGEGGDGSTPAVGNVFRAPDILGGTTSNVAGADLTISAGLGTGTGDAGTLIFQLPEVVTAGNTIQTRATVLTMDMVASTTDMSFLFTPNTTLSCSGTLTLGAIALSGAVAGGDQSFTGVGDMTFTAGSILKSGSTNTNTLLLAANDTTFITLTTGATDTMTLGSHSISGAVSVTDDILFALGTNSDQVFLNRSTTLAADEELTGVIVGTSDISALAANSLIISNVTTDGDILIACNDGGNSKQMIFLDGSTGITHLGKPGSAVAGTAAGDVTIAGALGVTGFIYAGSYGIKMGSATAIYANDEDGHYFRFYARDTGVSLVEVARVVGAADPYFSIGGSQEFKFYYSGEANFSGKSPQNCASINNIAYAQMVEIMGDCSIFLPFSEATGSTVTDYTSNGHDATTFCTLQTFDTVPAYQGSQYVYDFNGTDEEMDVADHADFSTATAFSVGAWVYMTDPTDSTIIAVWDEATGSEKREFKLYLDSSDRPSFRIFDETNNVGVGRYDATALTADTWYHVVGVFTGGTDAANAEVYVNGLPLSDTDIEDEAAFADVVDSGAALDIGFEEDTSSAASKFFDGKMWGPFYTKKELSADEVWNLYKIGKGLLNV